MRLLTAATVLFVAATGIARAEDLACVNTTFNLLSPNDKVCVSDFEDPKVPGVVCFVSQARKGGWGQPLGLNDDPSNFSVACR
jgi:CreA protein